ncbi:MAG: penicillin-binding protein 1C [Alphaproteobacteria bacterium]|nr:penicillin-binding protein 1C [Alphaproteobacteria bacterium]
MALLFFTFFYAWNLYNPLWNLPIAKQSVSILDTNKKIIHKFLTDDGYLRFIPDLDNLDPGFVQMLLAYEDKNFFNHYGVDFLSIGRALIQNIQNNKIVSGASTITMQTVRLLEPGPRTVWKKLIECIKAFNLEIAYNKNTILQTYLTLTPYGGNLQGIRAASLIYFGKEPTHLNLAEAALLVALPQSPETLRPDRFPKQALNARNHVLKIMADKGVINQIQALEAMDQPVPVKQQLNNNIIPHLAYLLRKKYPNQSVIESYIDQNLQNSLLDLAYTKQSFLEPDTTIAMIVAENKTGNIKAYIGSSDYQNNNFFGANDMVQAIRSPGSTLKPFIYALAFDNFLIHPETIMDDIPMRFGGYAPKNFDHQFFGEITARQALQFSRNIPAVALLAKLGSSQLITLFKKAGADLILPKGEMLAGLPIALGGIGANLQNLVQLYLTLAHQGLYIPLAYSTLDSSQYSERLIGEMASWYTTKILEETPLPSNQIDPLYINNPKSLAFKTGTSYGFRDAWTIGYNQHYTVGVWVGRPSGSFSPERLGLKDAAPLFFEVFDRLPKDYKSIEIKDNKPVQALDISNSDLPNNLQHFYLDTKSSLISTAKNDMLKIIYPIDQTVIQLKKDKEIMENLVLQTTGGKLPLMWFANGHLITTSFRRQIEWKPDSAGALSVTVMDQAGQSNSINIWLQP